MADNKTVFELNRRFYIRGPKLPVGQPATPETVFFVRSPDSLVLDETIAAIPDMPLLPWGERDYSAIEVFEDSGRYYKKGVLFHKNNFGLKVQRYIMGGLVCYANTFEIWTGAEYEAILVRDNRGNYEKQSEAANAAAQVQREELLKLPGAQPGVHDEIIVNVPVKPEFTKSGFEFEVVRPYLHNWTDADVLAYVFPGEKVTIGRADMQGIRFAAYYKYCGFDLGKPPRVDQKNLGLDRTTQERFQHFFR